MTRIVVISEAVRNFRYLPYFIKLLIKEWEQTGIETVICGIEDDQPLPDADMAILHVDLTRIPESYQIFAKQFRIALNANTTDISKRMISRQLLNANDHYKGEVIVKTDANAGGRRERKIRYKTLLIGTIRRYIDKQQHWTKSRYTRLSSYPIYQTLDDVPTEVWTNPALVVERFIPERHEENYVLRQWVFFGDQEINKISFSPSPIVKANNSTSFKLQNGVPDELRSIRENLGFDYGKFDYIIHGGKPVLLDANRTPTFGINIGVKGKEYAFHLAQGIRFYFP